MELHILPVVRLVVLLATVGLGGCNGFFVDGHTSTIVSSSAVSASYGTSITLTAKVYSDGVLATGATGIVEFLDGSTELGTATLSSGQATYSTSSLATGTHTITAEYEGDTTYQASTSDDLSVVISSTLTSTITTVAASASSVVSGTALTFTATISSSAATGTVTFYDTASGTAVELGTATLSSGTASYSTNTLAVGTHTIYATYVGDSTYETSTSGTVSVTVTSTSSS